MGKEIEYKLRAHSAGELSTVYERLKTGAVALEERLIEMHTRYYDTSDRRLSGRHWTLRIRQENERRVLTCKTPGTGHSRGEWERETAQSLPASEDLCALAHDGAPQELCELPALIEVCGARFLRRCTVLELPDGTQIELAADEGQLYGKQQTQALFELELELRSGSVEQLAALAARAGLPEEPLSKNARAARLL